jgi:RimJ/RimL family protein N-acetyltransferase
MDANTIFETERLILRPFTTEDLSAVFERTSDPEVMQFHNCGTLTLDDTRTGLDHIINNAEAVLPFGLRAIVVKVASPKNRYQPLG